MRKKYKIEPVNTPEDLRQFEGWEIRSAHSGNKPGLVLQNPDSGEKIMLVISKKCFSEGLLKISRKCNLDTFS